MRTSRNRTSRAARRLRRRGLHLGLLAIGLVVLQASECSKEDFYDILTSVSLTGTVTGTVTVNGTPESGVAVTLREGTTVIGTTTTGSNGTYTFTNVATGAKTVSIVNPEGATCPGPQDVTVPAGGTATANFPCTTPQPQTGTVAGTVTVNGNGVSGVAVTLREGTTTIETTTTGTGGTYSFTNVATGTKNVSIATPAGATCPGPQDVNVLTSATATANFACTSPSGDFTVVLNDPPPGWLHDMPGVSSLECKVIRTIPAQPGALFSATTTGPTEGGASGVVTAQPVTGILDANGAAQLQVRINRLGTYVNVVTVILGETGINRSATQTITVLSTSNTCPQLSSVRFKRGVMALLPEDARPLGLRPVAFRYVEPWGDPAEPQIGLIAEEVAGVFPEAVVKDVQGRPDMIDYRMLTVLAAQEAAASVGRAVEAGIARWAERF